MKGNSVGYHLRTNKAIERKIFFDLIKEVGKIKPVEEYTYIGFGGPMMEDFREAHFYAGFENLISLENTSSTFERQKFNQPLGCIDCRKTDSSDFIDAFDLEENVTFWLDYTKASDLNNQLAETENLIRKLKTLDIVKVTLNANPDTIYRPSTSEVEQHKEHTEPHSLNRLLLEKVRETLGDDYFPVKATPEMMTTKNYPKLMSSALELALSSAVRSNAGKIVIPLTRFYYTDHTHQMFTFTGIIGEEGTEALIKENTNLFDWAFYSKGVENIHEIHAPALTMKEKLYLDAIIHTHDVNTIANEIPLESKKKDSKRLIENYVKYYKYYPNFQRLAI